MKEIKILQQKVCIKFPKLKPNTLVHGPGSVACCIAQYNTGVGTVLTVLHTHSTVQYSTLQYSTVSALSVQFVQSKYRVLIKISMRAVSNELVGRAAS